jgi:asparagine synthase (glutamine-hydrolysing)
VSGIVGLLDRDGTPVDDSTLRAMTDRLAHRGPDGRDIWADGPVGIGHQRLQTSTIPRCRGACETVPGVVVAGDLRLDNREELTDRLDVDDGCSDAEFVAHAYRRWGRECPTHLLGAFAFCLWDERSTRLFCARDHLGVKPVYYTTPAGRFAVASEPPPLFAVDGVTRRPNPERIAAYLGGHPDDRDETFYEEVARLPPAHHLTVTEDEVTVAQYWSVSDVEPLPAASSAEYERRFRELFLDAVATRLPDETPAGSFLSGGLDSGSIASAAGHLAERGDRPTPHTFSAVFDDVPECDEREFIEAVVEQGTVDPHTVRGDRVDPLAGLDRHLRHRGQPFHPSLFMLIWRLYQAVADEGLRVVLHGYGGDQVMGSDVRPHLRGLLRAGRLPTFAHELSAYLDRYDEAAVREVLWYDIGRPLVPTALRRLWHSRFDDEWYLDRTFAPIDPEFARRVDHPARVREAALTPPPMSYRAALERSLRSGELPFHLELNNIAAATVGVEARFPYLDKRVVEFSLGLPPEEAVQGGLDRAIVRNALTGILPREISERTFKTVFSANIRHCVEAYALATVAETLFDGPPAVSRYLKVDGVRQSFDAFDDGDPTAVDARVLLMATTLERWLDQCIDGR